jgi:hypothetical protein
MRQLRKGLKRKSFFLPLLKNKIISILAGQKKDCSKKPGTAPVFWAGLRPSFFFFILISVFLM